jgi:hypothetical protein
MKIVRALESTVDTQPQLQSAVLRLSAMISVRALGFGVALCVVEPDSADEFLKKSSSMFERVFQEPARKKRNAAPYLCR